MRTTENPNINTTHHSPKNLEKIDTQTLEKSSEQASMKTATSELIVFDEPDTHKEEPSTSIHISRYADR
ncbi:hypothetical protein [Coxiella-like endosymbiont]|uniref:hypothetical protein n=1 Tax=Coxiella-like endosymbiont TaxID=1592897 RepID=UPI00272B8E9C|nr:hypothetical protein [Coxiella-like endosymbiont]